MAARVHDGITLAAILSVAVGLTLTARSSPQAFTRPGSWMLTAGACIALGLALWSKRRGWGDGGLGRGSEPAMRTQIATLEAKVRQQTEQIREMATVDDLTGVLRRCAFYSKLEDLIQRDARMERPFALLLIDIEGFRSVNATKGRLAGDEVLKRVARALRSSTRGTDHVGRLESDEFAVALGECEDPGPVVDRFFLALVDGKEPVHAAVGAVLVKEPSRGLDLNGLLRVAVEALSSVRGTGTSRCGRRVLGAEAKRTASPPQEVALR